jgi:hypothetical protein
MLYQHWRDFLLSTLSPAGGQVACQWPFLNPRIEWGRVEYVGNGETNCQIKGRRKIEVYFMEY